MESIDFPKYKNLNKDNKYGQRKSNDIINPIYKCPSSNPKCYECKNHNNKRGKESRKKSKTKLKLNRMISCFD